MPEVRPLAVQRAAAAAGAAAWPSQRRRLAESDFMCVYIWSGVEWDRPGRWRGPPRSGYTVLPSSFSEAPQASSPLRRGSVRQKPCLTRGGQGATSREQHPRGGGGGGEEESGEQGDGTEEGETNTDRLFPGGQRGRSGDRVPWVAGADRGRRGTGGGSRDGARSKRRYRAAATRRRRQDEQRNGHSDGPRKRPRLRRGRAASKGCGALASRRGRPHPGAVGGLGDECHPLVAEDDKGLMDHSEERAVRGSGGGQLSGH